MPKEKEKTEQKPMWVKYSVRLDFTRQLCGSCPANPDIIKSWLEARMPSAKPPGGRSIPEIQEEVLASLAEPEMTVEQSQVIFQRLPGSENGDRPIVVRAETVRAHLKECARVVSSLYIGKVQGERSISSRVKNGVYVFFLFGHHHDQWIPVMREGLSITEPDGTRDKPVHAILPNGQPVNALKQFEYIDPPASISFELRVLGGCVSKSDLETLFEYGAVHGYGGERSDGAGKYTFEIVEAE